MKEKIIKHRLMALLESISKSDTKLLTVATDFLQIELTMFQEFQ